jgi:hypothetical protein
MVSGHSYLAASLRTAPGLAKLLTAKPQLCDHTFRVCIGCVHQWNWDYQISFERTVAGRNMWQELPKGWDERGSVDG